VLASRAPKLMRQLTRQRVVGQSFAPETEEQITGTSHGRLGAYLLGLWGIEHPVVEAVAFHHHPALVQSTTFDLPSVVHVADALVHAIENERAGRSAEVLVDRQHLEAMGVLEQLDDWRAAGQELWDRESG